MGLNERLKRLEANTVRRNVLVCPECGAEFVVWGDAAFEYLCADWVLGSGNTDYSDTPPDVAALFEHEHDPGHFLDKKAGLPFLSREVSGMDAFVGEGWRRARAFPSRS